MEQGERLPARSVDIPHAWMRAACAVHKRERQLRQSVTDMHKLADAFVVRMQLMGYGRARDGILSRAIQLRDRLAAEAHAPALLERWQRTFDELERERRELGTRIDDYLERELAEWGLPEAPAHQLSLRFATS